MLAAIILYTKSIYLHFKNDGSVPEDNDLTLSEKMNMIKVHQIDVIGFLAKRNGNYIRWESYHVK